MTKKAIIIAGISLLLLAACSDRGKTITVDVPKGVVTMKGLKLTQTTDGKMTFQIFSNEANIMPSQSLIKFYKVRAKYFGKDGREASNLVSEEGNINTVSNDIQVTGHVVLKSAEGSILETEKLNWLNRNGRVYTELAVRVTKGGNVMTGIGLETDMQLENIDIKKVTTEITDIEGLKENKAKK